MTKEIKYIELKTGYNNNGPAWIGEVAFSKSKKTIYFNGMAFKSLNAQGILGNYQDIETGEEYWISGIKKEGKDRLNNNSQIFIDEKIVNEYLAFRGAKTLDKNIKIVPIKQTDISYFNNLENEKL